MSDIAQLAPAAQFLGWLSAKLHKKATKYRKKAIEFRQRVMAAKELTRQHLIAFIQRRTSHGEWLALVNLRNEFVISSNHRIGLRRIRRESLSRPTKLNLGCGPFPKTGFLNIDLFPGGDLTLDLRRGLPFESNCCDFIFSEHFFEHIDYPDNIRSLFHECLRVLKPGGELWFSVPDTEWPIVEYRDPNSAYYKACEVHDWHPQDCETRMEHINYHFRQGTEHRFAYDFETAVKVLTTAGFAHVQQRAFNSSFDSEHRRIGSLFVAAQKSAEQHYQAVTPTRLPPPADSIASKRL